MRRLTAIVIAVVVASTVLLCGCSQEPETTEVEMFGKAYQVEDGKEVKVEVKISNCVSDLDGYVYDDTVTTITGTAASLPTKADGIKSEWLKSFKDAGFTVLSIDGKAV